jgi:mitogen-activated protein kinase kinase 1
MNMWNMKEVIQNQPTPQCPEEFSPQFRDFVEICLNKNKNERSDCFKLESHPWIVKCSKIPRSKFVGWLDLHKKQREKNLAEKSKDKPMQPVPDY